MEIVFIGCYALLVKFFVFPFFLYIGSVYRYQRQNCILEFGNCLATVIVAG